MDTQRPASFLIVCGYLLLLLSCTKSPESLELDDKWVGEWNWKGSTTFPETSVLLDTPGSEIWTAQVHIPAAGNGRRIVLDFLLDGAVVRHFVAVQKMPSAADEVILKDASGSEVTLHWVEGANNGEVPPSVSWYITSFPIEACCEGPEVWNYFGKE